MQNEFKKFLYAGVDLAAAAAPKFYLVRKLEGKKVRKDIKINTFKSIYSILKIDFGSFVPRF